MHLKKIDAKILISEAIRMNVLLTSKQLKDIDKHEFGFHKKYDRKWTIGDMDFFVKRILHNIDFRKDFVSAMLNTQKEPISFSRDILIEILEEDKTNE